MLSMAQFNRDDPFPSWFANAVGKALSLLTSQFVLTKLDATHVQLVAGPDDQASVIAIEGLWRWVEATITVAHPGGVDGTYPIFATAKNNDITNVPDPFTDSTDYSFQLVIEQPGQTPAIAPGAVDVYRHVGDAVWAGGAIVRIDQFAPQTPLHAKRHATGGPDPLAPADIGALATGDAHSLTTGDLVLSCATARAGAVLCDGGAYPRVDPVYGPLFAKIGTKWGAGDGATTFNVPDFRDKQIIGASVTHPLGSSGGAETLAIAVANLPPHYHGWGANTGGESNDHSHYTSGTTGGRSTGHLHGSVDGRPFVCATAAFSSQNWTQYSSSGHTNAMFSNDAESEGTTGWDDRDHTHGWGAQSGGRSAGHTHYVSGNTDNGNGTAGTPISLRDPYGTANVFILL